MSLLNILQYPDERLHKVAKRVEKVTTEVSKLIQDMAETMYSAKGIGLAAIQVNVQLRVVVIDVSEDRNNLIILINPEIIKQNGEHCGEEGCLSVPGFYESVTRAETVTVQAMDQEGTIFEIHAEGLLATCLQHEIDHLNGKVFVQYLSQLKQRRIRSKIIKRRQENARKK